ncbi:MAG: dihydrofolate reductase [Pseudonocardiaceae bacterium]|nr:dihydrofolate reductase [Pseudonocardiaceae bacterium]
MGKIVSSFFIALDGVVEQPDQWHFPYFDDEMGAAIGEGMASCAAFLMGRTMYDEWSTYWPSIAEDSEEAEIAAFFNNIRKYVISNSLTEAKWQESTIISGDIETKVRRLKDETDGNINMSGSAKTVRWLLAHGLVDELELMVHPIVVGKGQRLFNEQLPAVPLKLLSSKTFGSGVLHLRYGPDTAK